MADVYCLMNVVVVGLISVAPSGNPEQVVGWRRERFVGLIIVAPSGNPEQVVGWRRERLIRPTFSFAVATVLNVKR
ncbi:hypothetical protein, partial [Salmonella enterica]|uniref:hypothetical protein n=1 Tax=Salmonella enterica TaxID=28901 RepID=UPI001E32579B